MRNRIKHIAMVASVALAASIGSAIPWAGEALAATSCKSEGNWRTFSSRAEVFVRNRDPNTKAAPWRYGTRILKYTYESIDRYRVNSGNTGIETRKYKFESFPNSMECTVKIKRDTKNGTARTKFLSATCTGFKYSCTRNHTSFKGRGLMEVKFSIGD